MIIDTHCHLITSKFPDVEQVISDSKALGVCHAITQGTHRGDWLPTLELCARYPEYLSSCLAVHPTDCAKVQDDDMLELKRLCQLYPQVAIGEAGLDYWWPAPEGWSEEDYRARQHQILEQHFAIASDLGLNISIHTRDRSGSACFEDTVAIAKNFPTVRPVFHCFIGSKEEAKCVFEQLNGCISLTGLVTFKKTDALQALAAWAPIDGLMFETDAPYLSPEPFRGQLNIPGRTRFVLQKVASLRGLTEEQLAQSSTENAKRFFRFSDAALAHLDAALALGELPPV